MNLLPNPKPKPIPRHPNYLLVKPKCPQLGTIRALLRGTWGAQASFEDVEPSGRTVDDMNPALPRDSWVPLKGSIRVPLERCYKGSIGIRV